MTKVVNVLAAEYDSTCCGAEQGPRDSVRLALANLDGVGCTDPGISGAACCMADGKLHFFSEIFLRNEIFLENLRKFLSQIDFS